MKKFTIMLAVAMALSPTAHAYVPMKPSAPVPLLKDNVVRPVRIPEALGTSHDYQEELVEAYARLMMAYTGAQGFNPFHPPAFTWFEFRDMRTGALIRMYPGDTFRLRFADGSSVRVKFIGPFAPSGLFFQVVADSERDARSGLGGGGRDHYVYPGAEYDGRIGGDEQSCDFRICDRSRQRSF